MAYPHTIIATEQRRSTHGECCSETANSICKYAGANIPYLLETRKMFCDAPTNFYYACPYSASNNLFIPIYDPSKVD